MAQAPGASGLRVQLGKTAIDAADTRAVADAIAAANEHARVLGVPDALNPRLIDPAKVQALVAALAALSPSARAGIGHRALLLAAPDLAVKSSSPVTPASFAHLTGVEIVETYDDAVAVRLVMPPDCALAHDNAAAARSAVEAASADVARLEKARRTAAGEALTRALDDLGAARRRRFLLSIAWHENAAAVATCRPDDAAAKADLAAAVRARKDYVVSTGG